MRNPKSRDSAWIYDTQELSRRPLETGVAIDPPGAAEIDDAISVKKTSSTDVAVKIHIADAGLLYGNDMVINKARQRGWSRYGEPHTQYMLPPGISKETLSLGANVRGLGAAAITVAFGYDLALQRVTTLDVYKSRVQCETIAYDQFAERVMAQDPHSTLIYNTARWMNSPSDNPPPYGFSDIGHQTVSEYMITANRLMSEQMKRHQIPWLYRNHTNPVPAGMRDLDISTAEDNVFEFLTAIGRATYSPVPQNHQGLGLSPYSHFTSPLRRFADLANHLNLHAVFTEQPLAYEYEDMEQIAQELAQISAREAGRIALKLTRQRAAPIKESLKTITGTVQ